MNFPPGVILLVFIINTKEIGLLVSLLSYVAACSITASDLGAGAVDDKDLVVSSDQGNA